MTQTPNLNTFHGKKQCSCCSKWPNEFLVSALLLTGINTRSDNDWVVTYNATEYTHTCFFLHVAVGQWPFLCSLGRGFMGFFKLWDWNATIARNTDRSLCSISTAKGVGSRILKERATASIVLTQPPNGSFLRIRSEFHMLCPCVFRSYGRQTWKALILLRKAMLALTISFACWLCSIGNPCL